LVSTVTSVGAESCAPALPALALVEGAIDARVVVADEVVVGVTLGAVGPPQARRERTGTHER
jgi:hypothetical protein